MWGSVPFPPEGSRNRHFRTKAPKGRKVYDWWSRHPRLLGGLYAGVFLGREASFRRRAIETLDPGAGEDVLEVGCGSGNSFESLRAGVGPGGSVVGLDVSEGMVRSARARIRDAGWTNVHVVLGDARRPPMPAERFDAAYATMSLSAVPDPERAIASTASVLRPGGRFVVLDARPFQRWPWRLANPVVVALAERATNWVPEVDLLAVLRREFESVEVASFTAGAIVIVHAKK